MKSILTSQKGLNEGTGIGLILFVLIGVLPGSPIGGVIGLMAAGFIFGAPLEDALLGRVIVAISMIIGVVASAVIFIGEIGFLGSTAGFLYDAKAKTGVDRVACPRCISTPIFLR